MNIRKRGIFVTMKKIVLIIFTFISVSIHAQHLSKDSLSTVHIQKHQRILQSPLYRITHAGVPLILIGALNYGKDKDFRVIRNSYIPHFRYHYDDYLQYSPGVVMLGLKAFGIEGRSSWGRLLVSDAFSAGIMAATVNILKYSFRKPRPDDSGNNSFPSGHTATAFMFATMLHNEYGTTRSSLYSVLGYSLATGTAISRQLNNKHWFSDVLTGAGIGIVSTQLGYYLADLIFRGKGFIHPQLKWEPDIEDETYASLGIQMGYTVGRNKIHLPEHIDIAGQGGATSSLSTAWFFTPHWGIGGKFTIAQTSPQIHTKRFFDTHPEIEKTIESFEARTISYISSVGGIHYKTKILPGLYAGGSAMAGVGYPRNYHVNIRYKNQVHAEPLLHCESHVIPNLDLTAHFMHITGKNAGLKLFVNYNIGIGKSDYIYYPPHKGQSIEPKTGVHRFILHNFSIGAEVAALFW
ncbi:phosphatase PAP2 family protein [Bacteroides pyogenes]|uniref:phosphatase PAP2 family protein n=2 Tax=Bacteroides pyogenes TaxID=310300 RepID=UPI0011E453FA|nr:phosphatase PAP2 family protein [Bacteroides pyogenes]MBR8708645.1 hypothetical protein [Bacteroides pyogenes]MBR8716949.1 hypothetical protein [Bacteroides pyogenes]MBR8746905.1 hypothetical protein [Bacteroides pyogenes]MBR8757288.1 hypothetical protein [Bacteroides pyogenes]MBR8780482.1 hypothetical protein [Bacteroides pyogenes]